ncbi:MAG: VOC family protein [Candidatus Latescibacteria bacterium]|nr:VOC family protein [Candidatus Latescibacterota bacterium]
MFDHIGLFVSDFERSRKLYEACFAPLGIRIYQRQPEFGAVIFSGASNVPFLWVGTAPEKGDYHGTTLRRDQNRPMHIALRAPTVEAVRAFYRIAIEHGGRCNGEPEDCGNDYFSAYILDFDGNNIEVGIRNYTG